MATPMSDRERLTQAMCGGLCHHEFAYRECEKRAEILLPIVKELQAEAWDRGHRTYQQLGPDGCECHAYYEGECGCGLYGTNIITPNPYREVSDAPQ